MMLLRLHITNSLTPSFIWSPTPFRFRCNIDPGCVARREGDDPHRPGRVHSTIGRFDSLVSRGQSSRSTAFIYSMRMFADFTIAARLKFCHGVGLGQRLELHQARCRRERAEDCLHLLIQPYDQGWTGACRNENAIPLLSLKAWQGHCHAWHAGQHLGWLGPVWTMRVAFLG
ncbi:hypothetical protein [Reyranella soli]|uniref:hypothetical protein n=1 Tax=Reyranella soli TaxID=1230389 RepID=UPI0011BD5879|nr:hypothetical protein [Reyranella soli]